MRHFLITLYDTRRRVLSQHHWQALRRGQAVNAARLMLDAPGVARFSVEEI